MKLEITITTRNGKHMGYSELMYISDNSDKSSATTEIINALCNAVKVNEKSIEVSVLYMPEITTVCHNKCALNNGGAQ